LFQKLSSPPAHPTAEAEISKTLQVISHKSRLRLKQKQNHLSHFTVDEEKFDSRSNGGEERTQAENFPRVFANEEKAAKAEEKRKIINLQHFSS
jgi:hypothetical protein